MSGRGYTRVEQSSDYDEILGAFDRSITMSTTPNTRGRDLQPEPQFDTTHAEILGEACEEIIATICDSNMTPPPLPSDPPVLAALDTTQTIDLGVTNVGSNEELYNKFIEGAPMMDRPSFTRMMDNIRINIDPAKNDEEREEIGGELGKDIRAFIEETTLTWTQSIFQELLIDKELIDKFVMKTNFNAGIIKDGIIMERAERNDDRNNLNFIIGKMAKYIRFLRESIAATNEEIKNPTTLIQTRHEQQRSAHRARYKTAMDGLEKISKGLHDTSAAIRHYSNMEIECSARLHENIGMVSFESIDTNESDETDNTDLKRLEIVQSRVGNLGKVYESLINCIRGVLTTHYAITTSISSEKTMSLLSTKEFDLPIGLDKTPNPIVAQTLVNCIRTLLHSLPQQTWSLHSTLERIFVDTSKTSIHWSPTPIDDKDFTWVHLRDFYRCQNKALFELLERRNFNAVHKSYHTLITGDIDDQGTGANTRGGRDDAIACIAWWIRYHTRSGFKDRQKIKDIFNHAFGPLGDSDIQSTLDKLRTLIPTVRRLGIKLSYESVITQSVNVLQSRHPSFISSLEPFKRIPDD